MRGKCREGMIVSKRPSILGEIMEMREQNQERVRAREGEKSPCIFHYDRPP